MTNLLLLLVGWGFVVSLRMSVLFVIASMHIYLLSIHLFLFQYISISISVLNGRSLLQDLVHIKELFFQMGTQTIKSQVSQIFSSNKNIET
jgi:hypothetical protein